MRFLKKNSEVGIFDSFRFFPATVSTFQTRRSRPGHSDAPGREGWLAFLQPRNFGEKIPMGENVGRKGKYRYS